MISELCLLNLSYNFIDRLCIVFSTIINQFCPHSSLRSESVVQSMELSFVRLIEPRDPQREGGVLSRSLTLYHWHWLQHESSKRFSALFHSFVMQRTVCIMYTKGTFTIYYLYIVLCAVLWHTKVLIVYCLPLTWAAVCVMPSTEVASIHCNATTITLTVNQG